MSSQAMIHSSIAADLVSISAILVAGAYSRRFSYDTHSVYVISGGYC